MYIQKTEKIILTDEEAELLQDFMNKLEIIAYDLEDDGLNRVADNLHDAIDDFLKHPNVHLEE